MCWREEAHFRDFANRGFPRQASSRRKGLLRWCTDAPVARLTARRRRAYGRLIPNRAAGKQQTNSTEAAQKSERRGRHPAHRSESSATTHKTRVSASRDALLVIEDKRELARRNCTAQEAAAVLDITQYAANDAQCIACCSQRDWLQKEAHRILAAPWPPACPCSSRTSPSPPPV